MFTENSDTMAFYVFGVFSFFFLFMFMLLLRGGLKKGFGKFRKFSLWTIAIFNIMFFVIFFVSFGAVSYVQKQKDGSWLLRGPFYQKLYVIDARVERNIKTSYKPFNDGIKEDNVHFSGYTHIYYGPQNFVVNSFSEKQFRQLGVPQVNLQQLIESGKTSLFSLAPALKHKAQPEKKTENKGEQESQQTPGENETEKPAENKTL